jgi:hypothetical protein
MESSLAWSDVGVEVATHEAIDAQFVWRATVTPRGICTRRVLMPKSIQSEPLTTRCGPRFNRTSCTLGINAYSSFARTENTHKKSMKGSRQS